MNDSPFAAIGDEPVEARIVAWVLGEASAFEVAELERLCEERPELLIFRRRMSALHGLLTEAESAQPDEGWKLTPEKRQRLDEILGKDSAAHLEVRKEQRIRHNGRRALYAIAACVMISFVLLFLFISRGISDHMSREAQMNLTERRKDNLFKFESASGGSEGNSKRDDLALRRSSMPKSSPQAPATTQTASAPSERQVNVGGQISSPGPVAYKDGMTLGDAVDSAQGSTEFGSLRRVRVIRDGKIKQYDLTREEARRVKLEPGDSIDVPQKNLMGDGGGVPLTTNIPKESLEGSPKKIVLPETTPASADEMKTDAAGLLPPLEANQTNKPGSGKPFAARAYEPGKSPLALPPGPEAQKFSALPASPPSPSSADARKRTAGYAINQENAQSLAYGGGEGGGNARSGQPEEQAGKDGYSAEGKELAKAKWTEKRAEMGNKVPVLEDSPSSGADHGHGLVTNENIASEKQKEELARNESASANPPITTAPTTGPQPSKESAAAAADPFAAAAIDSSASEEMDASYLNKAIRAQEDKVEERRKLLATIVRTKGIVYKGLDSYYDQSGVDEDQGARTALQDSEKLEAERLQLQSQIKSLLKYDNDQLMIYASGLNAPDNIVRNLYPQYQEAKHQLETLKTNGLSENHPSVMAAAGQAENMKRHIDEGVINLRATLQAQLDMVEKRLQSGAARKNETRDDAIKRGLDAQDYVDAKKDFETDQAILQQLRKMQMELAGEPETPKPAPRPDLSKLTEETATTEDPYSTFSLNVSDASFKIAQAALAKGEQPDPAGIKVEQFYNAVDYGDPAPAAGEPVAVNIEQSAHPVIPGRNLVRVALKTAAAGRSAAQPLRLTLVVDQSGSMVREDRRAAMDKALDGLAKLLTKNDVVTVVGFARKPHLLAEGLKGDQAAKLKELVNQSACEGGTNMEEAINLGEVMAERNKLAGAQNRIVLFTDGAANLGDANPAHLAEKVKSMRQKGIALDIAGIAADELNDELLGDLARNGNGRYYVVGKDGDADIATQLAGAFHPAAENVKVQVRFNSERVGHYKLIGFEKDRLNTEDFRNDAVAAAQLAAEEAGVAIYQVETLPAGNGEIGEVSVRFRKADSGEMVERTWTIPHNAATPAFDRATPSMQLSVLAMLAAEKLRGGPLGQAIDFKQLVAPRANVKAFYGNTGRVAEVLHMIDSL